MKPCPVCYNIDRHALGCEVEKIIQDTKRETRADIYVEIEECMRSLDSRHDGVLLNALGICQEAIVEDLTHQEIEAAQERSNKS